MLPSDPKKAAELGKAWGEVLGDSIFGVLDVLKNGKGMKEAANKKMELQNQRQSIKNAKIRSENAKKLHDEEMRMLATLSPAEKEKYFKEKAEKAKFNAQALKDAEADAEERVLMLWLAFTIFVIVPGLLWVMLAGFAVIAKASGDYATYSMLSKLLPGFH